jgi:hypothetical protein
MSSNLVKNAIAKKKEGEGKYTSSLQEKSYLKDGKLETFRVKRPQSFILTSNHMHKYLQKHPLLYLG